MIINKHGLNNKETTMKNTLFAALLIFTAAQATAETYKIDPSKSMIRWKAGKKIGAYHNGGLTVKNGTIETDAKGNIKNATVVADMKSITNEDLKDNPEYHKKLLTHLSSDDFFKVEQFPESTFALTSVEKKATDKGDHLVKGKLTMLGKTENVEFPAKINKDATSISGSGTLVIERLKWGLKYGSGSLFKELTADKVINDSFEITLNLFAKK